MVLTRSHHNLSFHKPLLSYLIVIMNKNNQNKNINFGKITWTILEIIARTPEGIVSAFLDQKSIYDCFTEKDEFLSDRFMRYLRNLKQRGYIETKKINKTTCIKLTIKGKIKNLEHSPDRTTDGRLRVLSYDIPEKIKYKRQQFCRLIRRIGFKQLQKSLWVCPYIKADQIDIVVEELILRKYIAYFIIDRSNVDDYINRLFKKT